MPYQSNITGTGERDCTERWDLIKKELPSNGVVLDVGSAEGYFTKCIAEQTNNLAVSVVSRQQHRRTQARWCMNKDYEEKEKKKKKHIDFETIELLGKTPEWFDAILLLSILHWIKDATECLKILSTLGGVLIIELPNLDDPKAGGQKFLREIKKYGTMENYLRSVTQREVRKLGTVKAHTSKTRDIWIVEGDIVTKVRIPHVQYTRKKPKYKRTYTKIYKDKKFSLIKNGGNVPKGQEDCKWKPGVNVVTLKLLQMVFPVNEYWLKKLEMMIAKLPEGYNDVRMHNLIITNPTISEEGMFWIDLFDSYTPITKFYIDIEGYGLGKANKQILE